MTSSPSVAQPLGHHPCITEVSEAERGHARSVSQTRSPLKTERVHHGSFRRPRLALLSLGHSPLTKVTLHPRAWQLLASALDRSSMFPLCESVNSVGVRVLRVLLPGGWERTLPSVSCPVLFSGDPALDSQTMGSARIRAQMESSSHGSIRLGV